jgi:hypothetical protein
LCDGFHWKINEENKRALKNSCRAHYKRWKRTVTRSYMKSIRLKGMVFDTPQNRIKELLFDDRRKKIISVLGNKPNVTF